jgi:hypothetical protein
MGYAAFASHDYATASLLFDAAVAEDIRRFGPTADKPALLFIRLEDKDQEVLASQIIREIIASVNELLNDYSSRVGATPINLDELRTHFIQPILSSPDVHKRTLITAFISFIAEWKYRERLIDLIERGSREPFFLHFYRGCLLFESLVKGKLTTPLPADRNTLGPALQQMYSQLQIPHNLVLTCSDFDFEKENRKLFWENVEANKPRLSEACGCYVFAIQNGGNLRAWYVGKTEKNTFSGECFEIQKNLYTTKFSLTTPDMHYYF